MAAAFAACWQGSALAPVASAATDRDASIPAVAATLPAMAPVRGHAIEFGARKAVTEATVTSVGETPITTTTDATGAFTLRAPVGQPLTLRLSKAGYRTTQYATVMVPPGGLVERLDMVWFQVPSSLMYDMLSILMPVAPNDKEYCQFVVTVSAYNLTVLDFPQGEPNSTAAMAPVPSNWSSGKSNVYYFGTWGKISNATNPFAKGLNSTSWDGGVVLINVPPAADPYTVSASKPGVRFSSSKMLCPEPGIFVNAPPPAGPQVLNAPSGELQRPRPTHVEVS